MQNPRLILLLNYGLATIGSLIGAISVMVFLAPSQVAPSGVSGIALILNHIFGFPISVTVLILNIPILYLGYRMLPGGWKMLTGVIYIIIFYSIVVRLFETVFVGYTLSDDRLLNTIFGGVTGGLSTGLVYRSGFSFGSTSMLALIIQRRTGFSMSTTFLITDMLIIVSAGVVFGIEGGLYALVVLFISGLATDYVMEGPSVIRTATIITDKPEELSQAIIERLHRGVTMLAGRGMYSGQERSMLYVTIGRSQANELRQIVSEIDTKAFLVIGHGHAAYGEGFRPIKNGH